MANRILRDWTQSETVDQLSEGAEVFFTRLIMKADDFGCYYGNPKLLLAALFPLKGYNFNKIIVHRDECQHAGLINVYVDDGKEYVQIVNFGQRLRQMTSKFPQPSVNCQRIDSTLPPETKRNEVEEKQEVETEGVSVWPSFEDFWDLYDKKVDRPKSETKWKKINQVAREKIMNHVPMYKLAQPDKKYRKDPSTYLNNQSWENEIILNSQINGKSTIKNNVNHLREAFAKRVLQADSGEAI